jgi:excisionase family DNA binding protein
VSDSATLAVSETAKELGVGERAVRDGVARGEIPAVRFGRLIRIPRWWVQSLRTGPSREAGVIGAAAFHGPANAVRLDRA